ncbi:MAG: glucosamine-6-phosphate deaminase [Candidatus Omnitrophica bacterium]|nr:glucosamine-6-phosphate deaminase [Candidatus Omnitrophota bacterium]
MGIIICKDKNELGEKASKQGASAIRDAITKNGKANIIVATGASQFEMLGNLVKEDIQWNKVTAFHLDEYVGIPITHPASFRLYLWKRFVSNLPFPLQGFYYINAEHNPGQECKKLNEIIVNYPIDVAFIGIGENGHLAFNDPPCNMETEEPYIIVTLDEACRKQQLGEGWFKTFEDVPKQAVSMSMKHILKSKKIICSVPDKRKAKAVRDAFNGPVSVNVPASFLQTHDNADIYLDTDSASLLK